MRGISEDVLEAVVRALQLDDVERAHLFHLVRAVKLPPSPWPDRRDAGLPSTASARPSSSCSTR